MINHVGDGPHGMAPTIAASVARGGLDPDQWPEGWWKQLNDLYREGRTRPERTAIGLDLQKRTNGSVYYPAWLALEAVGLLGIQQAYDRLGSLLTLDDVRGESVYYGLCPPTHADFVYWSQRTGLPYTGTFPRAGDVAALGRLLGATPRRSVAGTVADGPVWADVGFGPVLVSARWLEEHADGTPVPDGAWWPNVAAWARRVR